MSPEFREWLLHPRSAPDLRVLLLAAHPDDETLGAGAHLLGRSGVLLLHLTDGAPLERRWWGAQELPNREEYAARRQSELQVALEIADFRGELLPHLGIIDQQATRQLAVIAQRLGRMLGEIEPDLVLTHPYEGGHPDHDACAFALWLAVRNLSERGRRAPERLEFASYHAGPDGGLEMECFLPHPDPAAQEVYVVELNAEQRIRKRAMVGAFASQARTLELFPLRRECFRSAPEYDFSQPPHPGAPYYERFAWGTDLGRWLSASRAALNSQLRPAVMDPYRGGTPWPGPSAAGRPRLITTSFAAGSKSAAGGPPGSTEPGVMGMQD